jgi:hypothetical protein
MVQQYFKSSNKELEFPLTSPIYSRLIFILDNKKLTQTEIAINLRKHRGTISKQINKIKEYINFESKNKKEVYLSLNYDKIFEEFSNYVLERYNREKENLLRNSDESTLKFFNAPKLSKKNILNFIGTKFYPKITASNFHIIRFMIRKHFKIALNTITKITVYDIFAELYYEIKLISSEFGKYFNFKFKNNLNKDAINLEKYFKKLNPGEDRNISSYLILLDEYNRLYNLSFILCTIDCVISKSLIFQLNEFFENETGEKLLIISKKNKNKLMSDTLFLNNQFKNQINKKFLFMNKEPTLK